MAIINDIVIPIIIAIFGGLVRIAREKENNKHYTLSMMFSGILTAAFAGVLVYWLTSDFEMSENARSATVAISGYASRDIVSILADRFIKRMKQ